jgi:hypothetical protein
MATAGAWHKYAWPGAIGVAAALPTLVWALAGGDLLVDDWFFAAAAEYRGPSALPFLSRPLESGYNALTFHLLGDRPLAHLLLLAVLNGVAAVLVWQVARRQLPTRLAVLTTLAWTALPNRGSMRLWISNAPHVLSLCLLLSAALLTCRQWKREPGAANVPVVVGLVVLAALAYEGSILLGLCVALAVGWRSGATRRDHVLRAGAAAAPVAVAALTISLNSPKRAGEGIPPFEHFSALVPAHFGVGVLPPALLAAGMVLLVAIAWSLASLAAPTLRARAGVEERTIAAGLAVLVLGALPFAVAGFPFATAGIFDRGNLFADLGTALIVGGTLGLAWRLRRPVLAGAVAVAALAVLAAGNVTDVRDWRIAAADGRRLLQASMDTPLSQPAVVVPIDSAAPGVPMFVEPGNLSDAIAVRAHRYPGPRVEVARTVDECTAMAVDGAVSLRLEGARLVPAPCA